MQTQNGQYEWYEKTGFNDNYMLSKVKQSFLSSSSSYTDEYVPTDRMVEKLAKDPHINMKSTPLNVSQPSETSVRPEQTHLAVVGKDETQHMGRSQEEQLIQSGNIELKDSIRFDSRLLCPPQFQAQNREQVVLELINALEGNSKRTYDSREFDHELSSEPLNALQQHGKTIQKQDSNEQKYLIQPTEQKDIIIYQLQRLLTVQKQIRHKQQIRLQQIIKNYQEIVADLRELSGLEPIQQTKDQIAEAKLITAQLRQVIQGLKSSHESHYPHAEMQELQKRNRSLEQKVGDLKEQLVKSSFNNINAIFDSEVCSSMGLNERIGRLHAEMKEVKAELARLPTRILARQEPISESARDIKINIHHVFDSDDEVNDSSMSDKKHIQLKKSKKNSKKLVEKTQNGNTKRMKSVSESEMAEILSGCKQMQGDYRRISQAIGRMDSYSKQIAVPFQENCGEQNLRQIQSLGHKFDMLLETLQFPERVKAETRDEEDFVQCIMPDQEAPELSQLRYENQQLNSKVHELSKEKEILRNQLHTFQNMQLQRSLQEKHFRLFQQFCNYPYRSRLLDIGLEQKINEENDQVKKDYNGQIAQMNEDETNGQREQTKGNFEQINGKYGHFLTKVSVQGLKKQVKPYSSHSQHREYSELEKAKAKIRDYEFLIKEKEIRINVLENAIFDHFNSKPRQYEHLLGQNQEGHKAIRTMSNTIYQVQKENAYLKQSLQALTTSPKLETQKLVFQLFNEALMTLLEAVECIKGVPGQEGIIATLKRISQLLEKGQKSPFHEVMIANNIQERICKL